MFLLGAHVFLDTHVRLLMLLLLELWLPPSVRWPPSTAVPPIPLPSPPLSTRSLSTHPPSLSPTRPRAHNHPATTRRAYAWQLLSLTVSCCSGQAPSLELHPVRYADMFNLLTSGLLPLFINESFGDPAFSCAGPFRPPSCADKPRCAPE